MLEKCQEFEDRGPYGRHCCGLIASSPLFFFCISAAVVCSNMGVVAVILPEWLLLSCIFFGGGVGMEILVNTHSADG